MTREIMIFENENFGRVRTVEKDGKIYFCGKDIAEALGYSDTAKAIRTHCKGVDEIATPTNGGIQSLKYIPEGDVYRLIVQSKLPSAEKFERWLFDEVLPEIREHGAYLSDEVIERTLSDMDYLISLANIVKEERAKRKQVEAKCSELTVDNQIMKPKADYFDELVDRNLLTGVRETAKELHVPEKKFTRFLLEQKYMYRDGKKKLKPYAEHTKSGLFEIKECFNEKTGWKGTQVLITPKGRETFRLLCIDK